eukprot:TRINITY_DN35311_c0_g1_i1.p2 TRINITY_DN35311_c0_g1~~TRINITY_DN35311_c0_g1_i1.p2  ORF type:complete len:124 (-),score=41.49 TRINITY_DN35311_c0_g1_i1:283-654(-)
MLRSLVGSEMCIRDSIKEINDLRREVKTLKAQNGRIVADASFKAMGNSTGKSSRQRPATAAAGRSGAVGGAQSRPSTSGRVRPGGTNNEVEMLHAEIFRLRRKLEEVENKGEAVPVNAWLSPS